MNRKTSLERLGQQEFDICIIGGGASGAGCALDAAARGWKVALIEQGDFASGTSSKSTKLIHGGVRYLEQAVKKLDISQLKQVHHGLQERYVLLKNAPHLARPLPILTPVTSFWEGLYYAVGLQVYGWFVSKKDPLPKSRWLSKAAAKRFFPALNARFYGAVLYYDGQLDDARYNLELVLTAEEKGAVVANYVSCTGFNRNEQGQITAAICQNTLSNQGSPWQIRAKAFLNCTGPFSDAIRILAHPGIEPRIRLSKGVHAVLPFPSESCSTAMLIPKTKDGRVVFLIPFQGRWLLGTTDDEVSNGKGEALLERKELDYLLETLNPFLDQPVGPDAVLAGFGGYRPLISDHRAGTKGLLRDHAVELDSLSGLFSLLGGKWTTYRIMAKDAIDQIAYFLGRVEQCRTADIPLKGATQLKESDWERWCQEQDLPKDIAQHLYRCYGACAKEVANIMQQSAELAKRILPDFPFVLAEIKYAVQVEKCCTLRDFLARRIRLEILDWKSTLQAVPVVAQVMAKELSWSESEQQSQSEGYIELLEGFIQQTI